MYDKYQLKVTVPSINDEYDEKLNSFLMKINYRHEFWNAFAPPNKRVLTFNGLSAAQVENAKTIFREMYAGHKFITSCSFEVSSEDGQVV